MHASLSDSHVFLPHFASTSRRVGRTVIAMMSVWCLGCSAFDPIVEQLLGSSASMRCAGGTAAEELVTAQGAADSTPASVDAVDAEENDRDSEPAVSCGCESCVAPAAAVSTQAFVVTLPHAPLRFDLTTPLSVAPQPLVPPPQSSL